MIQAKNTMRPARPFLWVFFLAGCIVAGIALFLIPPPDEPPLTSEQVEDLRQEYPLYKTDCGGTVDFRALDLDYLVRGSTVYVNAAVVSYQEDRLVVEIGDVLFQGDGHVPLNEKCIISEGQVIGIPVQHKPNMVDCTIEFPDFMAGDRYLLLLYNRGEDTYVEGIDPYSMVWDGLFYIVNGTHVLSAHNTDNKASKYDGWTLRKFKNEIRRFRETSYEEEMERGHT